MQIEYRYYDTDAEHPQEADASAAFCVECDTAVTPNDAVAVLYCASCTRDILGD